MELKHKVDFLNINITEVFRDSLMKAIEDAEATKIQLEISKSYKPILTDELMKLKPWERYEAYKNDELSPESKAAMVYYRKAGLNLWERQNLPRTHNQTGN